MALLKRQERKADPALPTKIIPLIAWIIEDRERFVRCAVLATCLLSALVLSVTAGITFVVMAEEGLGAVKLRYLLPTGIFTGGSTLTWAYLGVHRAVKKKQQQKRASATETPAKH